MSALPLFFALLLSAWAWGGIAVRSFPRTATPWEEILLRFSWGWALMGLSMSALGLACLLQGRFLVAALAVPAPLLLLRARAPAKQLGPVPSGEKVLILLLAAGLLLGFAADGAPPLAHDALAYHLALPKLFWREGRLAFFPWNNASAWPHLLHFLYLPGVACGLPQTAQFIHGFLGLLSVAWIGFLTARFTGRWAGWAAALLWASSGLYKVLSATALSDLGMAAFSTGALAALVRYRENDERRWLLQAGALAGFSASVKLTGLIWVSVLALSLAFDRRPVRDRFRAALLFGTVSFAFAGPWLLWSWVKAGNPVWPFLYSIFGGKYWSADQSARWAAYGGEHLIAPGFVAACLQKLGVLLSVSRSADVFAGWLPIASVAALLWRRKSFFPGALSTAAPAVVAYTAAALFCGPPSARYFAPVFPWVAAGLASALESLRERRKVGAAAWTILAVVSLYTSPLTDGRIWRKAQVSFGLDSPQTELARLDVYAPSVWINGHLPPTAKILLLNDIRGFYLDRDYLWGDPVNQAAVSYDGVSDLSSLLVRWRAVGVTHVLFREGGLFWPADGAGAVRDFLTKVHPVVVVGGYILYEVP